MKWKGNLKQVNRGMTEITIYEDQEYKFNVPTVYIQYRLIPYPETMELEADNPTVQDFIEDCIKYEKERVTNLKKPK